MRINHSQEASRFQTLSMKGFAGLHAEAAENYRRRAEAGEGRLHHVEAGESEPRRRPIPRPSSWWAR
jgi:hypothetical protein